jgi:hypothetical protein
VDYLVTGNGNGKGFDYGVVFFSRSLRRAGPPSYWYALACSSVPHSLPRILPWRTRQSTIVSPAGEMERRGEKEEMSL